MKLLFIDHECHKKTRSAEFFLSVLRKAFDVVEHYYSQYYRTGAQKVAKDCDVAVIWEFPISRWRFFFPGKRNVFVPMYDNEWSSYWQWKRIAWSGMGVISFCDKVTEHARRCGVTKILDVRYFPDPDSLPKGKGDSKRVFLWERGEITRSVAEKLFPPSDGYVFDVKRADEFLERDAYLARIAKCGIVIAPRRKEGIGMAFLEAMAMWRCVVANDEATMNEYIKNGENGILFSADHAGPVPSEAISRAMAGVGASVARLRSRWLADAGKINDFIATQKPCRPSVVNRVKLALSYPLYLLEGGWHVLAERSSTICRKNGTL